MGSDSDRLPVFRTASAERWNACTWPGPQGRQLGVRFPQALGADRAVSRDSDSPFALRITEPLLQEWRRSLQASGRAPATIANYTSGANRFLRYSNDQQRQAELGPAQVRDFIAHLLEDGAPRTTVRARLQSIRRFSHWLTETGFAAEDPLRGLIAEPMAAAGRPALTPAQVNALLATCAGLEMADCRDAAIIRLTIDTSARIGEVLALTLPTIDLHSRTVTFFVGHRANSVNSRFSSNTADVLRTYIGLRRGHRKAMSDQLWVGTHDRSFSYQACYRALGSRAQRAGIAGFRPMQLRTVRAATAAIDVAVPDGRGNTSSENK
jgi:integrase/recombinase XerD